MRWSASLSSVAACFLAATASAEAPAPFAERQLVDPLDGAAFSWPYVASTNGLGGYDSDGCAYARGEQPRAWAVATSPTTLFTAPLDRWDREIPASVRPALAEVLLAAGRSVEDSRGIPPWQRWELAALAAAAIGDSDFEVGDLYLQGAWTVRDTIVGFLPGVQGASDAWSKLAETVPLAQKQTEPRPRTIALFDLARLSHRGGFPVERDSFLATLDSVPDAGLGALDKRSEFHRRVEEEVRLLTKARERYRRGLEGGAGDAEDRAFHTFLLGDLSRRLGDWKDAEQRLQEAIAAPSATDETKANAKDVLAVLKVQAREAPPAGAKAP